MELGDEIKYTGPTPYLRGQIGTIVKKELRGYIVKFPQLAGKLFNMGFSDERDCHYVLEENVGDVEYPDVLFEAGDLDELFD